jgi:hypothetical protein
MVSTTASERGVDHRHRVGGEVGDVEAAAVGVRIEVGGLPPTADLHRVATPVMSMTCTVLASWRVT